MSVTCLEKDLAMTACIAGEVDHHAAKQLMEELGRRIDAGLPRDLTLDLSGVTFMDSSGIAVVLRSYKRMRQLGGSVTLRAVPPQAGKVLRAAGVDRLISFTE